MRKSAIISSCGKYRYALSRVWDTEKSLVLWVMLNPSTADAELDDPTIRRCIQFSKDWGFGGMLVGNLYAFRSTDKRVLYKVKDPVGPENLATVAFLQTLSTKTIAAFGNDKGPGSRLYWKLIEQAGFNSINTGGPQILCVGHNKDQSPKHPLYVEKKASLTFWNPPLLDEFL